MKINRYIQIISAAIFVFYFVSMIAGPTWGLASAASRMEYGNISGLESYGWKGVDAAITYGVVIGEWGHFSVEVMQKNVDYDLYIICHNQGSPAADLTISLPEGFKSIAEPTHEILPQISKSSWTYVANDEWNNSNWKHIFKLKSPNKGGIYQFAFTGKDVNSRSFSFTVPITVVDDYGAYQTEKERNAYPPAFLIVAGLIATLAFMGQFIFK